uniref:Uncharacterized protein n=1 Tax=Anguilla anguilla TaxID=7936 RepID=A0A0E9XRP7_ANGAN
MLIKSWSSSFHGSARYLKFLKKYIYIILV